MTKGIVFQGHNISIRVAFRRLFRVGITCTQIWAPESMIAFIC